MSDDSSKTNSDTYAALLATYVTGLLRLNEAELASHRLSVSVIEFKQSRKQDGKDDPLASYLYQLDRMSYAEWDAFNYVSRLSHLVYATSLLDTFLNETTKFLLLLHPGAIGKEVKLTTEDLLGAKRPEDLLTIAVSRKAREVSYGSFKQRLDFLKDRFSLQLVLSQELADELEHFSSVRNVVVHDQGFIELSLAQQGTVTHARKSCARHPTVVTIEDLTKAYRSYAEVVHLLGKLVMHDVLHIKDHGAAEGLLVTLDRKAKGRLGELESK